MSTRIPSFPLPVRPTFPPTQARFPPSRPLPQSFYPSRPRSPPPQPRFYSPQPRSPPPQFRSFPRLPTLSSSSKFPNRLPTVPSGKLWKYMPLPPLPSSNDQILIPPSTLPPPPRRNPVPLFPLPPPPKLLPLPPIQNELGEFEPLSPPSTPPPELSDDTASEPLTHSPLDVLGFKTRLNYLPKATLEELWR